MKLAPFPLARRLLSSLWPGQNSAQLTEDLDEEYFEYVLPRRGRLQAGLWYWRQVVFSLPPALGRRLEKRLHSMPPFLRSRTNRGEAAMDRMLLDLRCAVRGLSRRRAISLLVVFVLALGIGAGTAIFSVVNAVVFEALPYRQPAELVRLMPDQMFPLSKEAALYIRDEARSFELAAWGRQLFPLSGQGDPEDARGAAVFDNHFSMLGTVPALGRGFLPEDAEPGASPVVILSHQLWTRRFGADPSIVGQSIRVGDRPTQVVGVMGPDHQPMEEDWLLWTPVNRDPQRFSHLAMAANGRLRPGFTKEQAQEELRRLMTEYWAEKRGYQATAEDLASIRVIPLRDWLLGDIEPKLLALLGAVGFVLLIVCANVANLLLALGSSRRHEMGVRLALGAGRGRLVRQLLTESGLLGVAGGAAGLILAAWAVQAGIGFLPPQIPRTGNIEIDGAVLAFALAVSLLSALLFGIAPALRSTGRRLASQLNASSRTLSSTGSSLRLNQGLVAVEVALSIVLLAGAGLMLRSMWALGQVDPGFNPRNVIVMRPAPPNSRYPDEEKVREYYRQARRSIERIPQVRSVGQIQFLPMTPGGWWSSYLLPERPLPAGQDPPSAAVRVVTPGYFSTMQTPLLEGRDFSEQDGAQAPRTALVNRRMAEECWPGKDPLGRQLLLGADGQLSLTIVGVVGDVRQSSLRTIGHPEVYLPFQQQFWPRMYFAVRVDGDAQALVAAVQDAIWSVDRQVSLSGVGLLEDAVDRTIADSRFLTALLAIFAAVALLLGAVGVYGVTSYLVSRRTRELGIRIALGAATGRLLRSTIGRGLAPVALGLSIGLPIALLSSRLLEEAVFQVKTADPATFAIAPLLLGVIAVLALYLPARRAARTDPVSALRGD